MSIPNWLKKLLFTVDPSQLQPGAHYLNDIAHDDWCDRLNGRGPCNCDPDIKLTRTYPPTDGGG